MSSRKQHIEEMRYAMAHNVTVLVARERLKRQRQDEAEAAAANVQSCGTRVRRPALVDSYRRPDPLLDFDAPWMMRN